MPKAKPTQEMPTQEMPEDDASQQSQTTKTKKGRPKSSRPTFTEAEQGRLVAWFEAHPFLWDKRETAYKDEARKALLFSRYS